MILFLKCVPDTRFELGTQLFFQRGIKSTNLVRNRFLLNVRPRSFEMPQKGSKEEKDFVSWEHPFSLTCASQLLTTHVAHIPLRLRYRTGVATNTSHINAALFNRSVFGRAAVLSVVTD